MTQSLIRARGLTKKFGDFTAVNGIDFDVMKDRQSGSWIDDFANSCQRGFQFRNGECDGIHCVGGGLYDKKPMHRCTVHGLRARLVGYAAASVLCGLLLSWYMVAGTATQVV